MDEMVIELKQIFLDANNKLLKKDKKLFYSEVSERTICGALMNKIYEQIKKSKYSNYYVDIEYNRNRNKNIKTCCINDKYNQYKIININCDLIIHSRGENIKQDNLVAIEMKKSNRPLKEKNSDRDRLIALTKDQFDDVSLPQHVCRYKLGIYYEINFRTNMISLEYYYKGKKILEQNIQY